MDLQTVKFSDFQSNFLNLSVLICQLFVGGNFRMAHILYHQEAFDDRLFNAIDSTCPLQIPMITTDISTQQPLQSDSFEQSDYILQLIFLPREQLACDMDHIANLLTFYRVFVFSSIEESNIDRDWTSDSKLISNINSSSLLIIHNKSSGEMKPYLLSKSPNTFSEPVEFQTDHLKQPKDLFDSMLGEKAFERQLGVKIVNDIDCIYMKSSLSQAILNKNKAFARLYFTLLNMSFIDAVTIQCNESGTFIMNKYIRPKYRSIYREFSTDEIVANSSR